jgi:hypothetical protein
MILDYLKERDAAVRQHFADRVPSPEDLDSELLKQELKARYAKGKNDQDVDFRRVMDLAMASLRSGRKDGPMAEVATALGASDPSDFAGFSAREFAEYAGLNRERARELVAQHEVQTAPAYRLRRLGNQVMRPLTAENPAARIGMVSGIVAGSAMALTPAAQGLIALTQNLQQENESATARQQPLGG